MPRLKIRRRTEITLSGLAFKVFVNNEEKGYLKSSQEYISNEFPEGKYFVTAQNVWLKITKEVCLKQDTELILRSYLNPKLDKYIPRLVSFTLLLIFIFSWVVSLISNLYPDFGEILGYIFMFLKYISGVVIIYILAQLFYFIFFKRSSFFQFVEFNSSKDK